MALATHFIPVLSEQLEPGMYVAELDRSWLHTPFQERGFLITQAEQIDILRRSCEYVYIDTARSEEAALLDLEVRRQRVEQDEKSADDPADQLELNGCRRVLVEAGTWIDNLVRQARRDERLDLQPVDEQIDRFVSHVLDWPDAIQWLLVTEHGQGYMKRRSLGTAIYAVLFGQRIGLDRTALRDVALGALILDIGKTRVPITILSKPKRLNPAERGFARRHVDQGIELVRFSAGMEQRVIDMVASHHERLDGSGYPQRVSGTDIPLYARIAGIADTFDAMTQNRGYASARSGHAAMRYLNTWRNIRFDASLVDEFIQALGVYPIGTDVELTDGSRGVVCRQHPREPTRPDVMLTRDTSGCAVTSAQIVGSAPHRRVRRAIPVIDTA